MSGLLEKLAARLVGRREKVASNYDSLIRTVADDKPPSLEDVEAILSQAGRTVQDMATDLNRLCARRQARAVLDQARAAPAELRRVAAALEAAAANYRAAVEQAEVEHAAAVAPLLERHRALERLVEDGKRAELSLRDSAREPAELAGLREQLAQAKQHRDRRLQQAGKAQAARDAAATAAQAGGNWSDSYREGYKQQALTQQAGVEQAIAAAEPHAEECRRLEKKIAEALDLSLVL